MKRAVVTAPCKVNLTLDITGKRENGYHEMEMVLASASLWDRVTVTLEEEEGIRLTCPMPGVPLDERNIAVRAAKSFLEQAGKSSQGMTIAIEKQIPMEAGLAGGSADGAAVLTALNALLETGYSLEELERMALPLGADVPFCLRGGVAVARGIGEEFTPLPLLPPCWMVIAKPEEGVSTAQAFHRIDELGIPVHPDTPAMEKAIREGSLEEIGRLMYNVLEPAAGLLAVSRCKEVLKQQGALGAVMTGSGSAVIGLFRQEEEAQRARQAVLPYCKTAFAVVPCGHGTKLESLSE